jgi:hypothetical protein
VAGFFDSPKSRTFVDCFPWTFFSVSSTIVGIDPLVLGLVIGRGKALGWVVVVYR